MIAQAVIRHNPILPRSYQGNRKWQMEVLKKGEDEASTSAPFDRSPVRIGEFEIHVDPCPVYLLWFFGASVQELFDKHVAPKATIEVIP